ncbi:hypothetical protein A2U01_0088363, partial [Trifolium medium]|nr:hypothetical protein [Trifolium medium]
FLDSCAARRVCCGGLLSDSCAARRGELCCAQHVLNLCCFLRTIALRAGGAALRAMHCCIG